MNEPMMDTKGIHLKLVGIESTNMINRARDPIERAMTRPEIISSGRLPALSIRVIDTG